MGLRPIPSETGTGKSSVMQAAMLTIGVNRPLSRQDAKCSQESFYSVTPVYR